MHFVMMVMNWELQLPTWAFDWPQIKTDDADSYSLFLAGYNNAMQDIRQLQEMENPSC